MVKKVSLDLITDDEIENLSIRRIKNAIGGTVNLIGSTKPNHSETVTFGQCDLCNNGKKLEEDEKTVCLRCLRGSKQIDKIIASVKAEERILQALAARQRVDLIKTRAMAQKLGRRGAKLNPLKRQIVMTSVLEMLSKND